MSRDYMKNGAASTHFESIYVSFMLIQHQQEQAVLGKPVKCPRIVFEMKKIRVHVWNGA